MIRADLLSLTTSHITELDERLRLGPSAPHAWAGSPYRPTIHARVAIVTRPMISVDTQRGHDAPEKEVSMSPSRCPSTTISPPGLHDRGRLSSRRKADIGLRLLRGELSTPSAARSDSPPPTIAGWRDRFLADGQAAVRSRETDQRAAEITRMSAKVGEITMEKELPRERARRSEANHPGWSIPRSLPSRDLPWPQPRIPTRCSS